MTINWIEVLASLIWAAGVGLVMATAFIWRMKRHEDQENKRFLDGLRRAQEGRS
jgi:hypothetical protein